MPSNFIVDVRLKENETVRPSSVLYNVPSGVRTAFARVHICNACPSPRDCLLTSRHLASKLRCDAAGRASLAASGRARCWTRQTSPENSSDVAISWSIRNRFATCWQLFAAVLDTSWQVLWERSHKMGGCWPGQGTHYNFQNSMHCCDLLCAGQEQCPTSAILTYK